tara:strand:- start:632 stop:1108 length:477 start_codon:yes stop_codon:yes gene_type:complete
MAKKGFENDKVLVALVALLLVGVVGFNLDKFTGNFTLTENKDIPIVTSFPKEIKAGEKINVNVQVRGACVHPEIEFHFGGVKYDGTTGNTGGRKGTVTEKGKFKFCKGDYELNKDNSFDVDYRTRPDWDGDYYAKVYYWKDRKTKDYVNSYFKVKPRK